MWKRSEHFSPLHSRERISYSIYLIASLPCQRERGRVCVCVLVLPKQAQPEFETEMFKDSDVTTHGIKKKQGIQ